MAAKFSVNSLLVGDFLLTRPSAGMILSHETTIVLDSFIVHDEQSCHWQLLVPRRELERTHKKKDLVQLSHFLLPKEPTG